MSIISSVLKKYQSTFHPIIQLKASERIASLNLSANNSMITSDVFSNNNTFTAFIEQTKSASNAIFLAGGYGELRNIYS